jgi:hypothetical protein
MLFHLQICYCKTEYIRAPDSFKASLIQMVTDGSLAFVNAHKHMESIETLANRGDMSFSPS